MIEGESHSDNHFYIFFLFLFIVSPIRRSLDISDSAHKVETHKLIAQDEPMLYCNNAFL